MTAKLVALPDRTLRDIPGGLRRLADQIESGEFGHNVDALAWVTDSETGIALGLLGGDHSGDAHLLFSVAAASMVKAVLDAKDVL